MTNGTGVSDRVTKLIKDIRKQNGNLTLFTIGLGQDYESKVLENITRAGNNDQLTKQLDQDFSLNLMNHCDHPSQFE